MNNACIILLCNTPWDWPADYVAKTAEELAKRNTVICIFWFEALSLKELFSKRKTAAIFRRFKNNIFIYQGVHVLPFRRYRFVREINITINMAVIKLYVRIIQFQRRFTGLYTWYFDPRQYNIARHFSSDRYTSIYDIVDYWRGASELSASIKKELILSEDRAIAGAGIVTVNSKTLFTLHSKIRKDIHHVPLGFRSNDYMHGSKKYTFPHDASKPIIGYVGHINNRLDYGLLEKLAKALPEYLFVFAGPKDNEQLSGIHQVNAFFSLPNVVYVGSVHKRYVPSVISIFDVCIVPYRTHEAFNMYSFPMKIMEYFYMGKPIVASPIKELKRFPELVQVASSFHEWQHCIKKILSNEWPKDYARRERLVAKENSWERKIHKIYSIISPDGT